MINLNLFIILININFHKILIFWVKKKLSRSPSIGSSALLTIDAQTRWRSVSILVLVRSCNDIHSHWRLDDPDKFSAFSSFVRVLFNGGRDVRWCFHDNWMDECIWFKIVLWDPSAEKGRLKLFLFFLPSSFCLFSSSLRGLMSGGYRSVKTSTLKNFSGQL